MRICRESAARLASERPIVGGRKDNMVLSLRLCCGSYLSRPLKLGRLLQTEIVSIEPPSPRSFGVSDEEAVELCREWMIDLGATDTVVAIGALRQLCDLYSARYLAWVDNRRGNLDVDPVDAAAALAASDGRCALIFVQGGVRPVAQERADALGVALLLSRSRRVPCRTQSARP